METPDTPRRKKRTALSGPKIANDNQPKPANDNEPKHVKTFAEIQEELGIKHDFTETAEKFNETGAQKTHEAMYSQQTTAQSHEITEALTAELKEQEKRERIESLRKALGVSEKDAPSETDEWREHFGALAEAQEQAEQTEEDKEARERIEHLMGEEPKAAEQAEAEQEKTQRIMEEVSNSAPGAPMAPLEPNPPVLNKFSEELPHTVVGNVGNKLQRMGMRIVHAPRTMFYRALHNWRSGRLEKAQKKYESIQTEKETGVNALQAKIANPDISERERNRLTRQLNKAQHRLDKQRNLVEHRTQKTVAARNELRAIGHSGHEWVEGKQRISQEKHAQLQAMEKSLQQKLAGLQSYIKEKNGELAALRAQQRSLKGFDRKSPIYQRALQNLKMNEGLLKQARFNADEVRRELSSLQPRMRRVHLHTTQWQTEGNRYLSRGNEVHTAPQTQEKHAPKPIQRPMYSHEPQEQTDHE